MQSIPIQTAALLPMERPDARLVQLAKACGGSIATNDV